MSNRTFRRQPATAGADLTARLWVLAGLLGITAGIGVVVTGLLDHLSGAAEAMIGVALGWLTMLAFAPWRRMKKTLDDRAEIRELTRWVRQINRDHRSEPLRKLLTDRSDGIGELSRAIYDTLTAATGHRLQARLLRRTMDHSIRRGTDRAAGHLQRQVETDPLTSLGNRRALRGQMERLLGSAKRGDGSLSVLMIDVDHFKQINDLLGHEAGDQCLVYLGRQLQSGLRRGDFAFRIGGDEFIVLIPGQPIEVAKSVAGRISSSFSQMPWPHGQPSRPTLSIGAVSARSSKVAEPQELLRRADEAMYAAKRSGRARIVAYDDLRSAA